MRCRQQQHLHRCRAAARTAAADESASKAQAGRRREGRRRRFAGLRLAEGAGPHSGRDAHASAACRDRTSLAKCAGTAGQLCWAAACLMALRLCEMALVPQHGGA
ncbi:hypothetical protein FA09DRAFT_332354 [Tilletiopsis washingtonensis]|uniref:Uncharacterized protein n=1 Tax=Tilletiopsis washingtonensis TaxID=58919 RepID=A0A316Z0X8_9BASI|nr:hypothetical protein FA09DRAFT_332354 [Tilletiopsis washingtonensis]PWN95189.1 hypothetical protein FA09DRAFT_332354 [Tilletiopsis washingtonensis]